MAINLTEAMILTAKKAGVPKDQVENFLIRQYVPFPWQWNFHAKARLADKVDGPVKVGAGGARGPGKSHCVFAQMTLDDCQRVPGLKGLFIRQTGRAASESFGDLIFKVCAGKIKYDYSEHKGILSFPNGSRIVLGGFRDERDIDGYIGIEYDLIAIEELNQLTEDKVDKLLGSMRTSKENWRPRLYASFNPGGKGHDFVKKLFVIPHREKKEKETVFIPSTYKDNPKLNQEYIDYLEGLSGNLGKAWREGDWDIFEGQYFSEWNPRMHVVEPFAIPETWQKYRAYDHGRVAPACCLWFAVDYDGNVYAYREYYQSGKDAKDIAEEIKRLSGDEKYRWSVADSSIFANQGHGENIADILGRYGFKVQAAPKNRLAGWALLHQYLNCSNTIPKLRIFSTCANATRTLPTLIHDERNPEDLDSSGEDHAADAISYFLQSLKEQKTAEPIIKSYSEKRFEELTGQNRNFLKNLNKIYD